MSRLIFRTDANATIGRGHLSRCMAVADMMNKKIEIIFVINQFNEEYVSGILKNYNYLTIINDEDILDILKIDDLLWLDGYHFTEAWKSKIRVKVKKLIETNDIPYPVKNVDILINHTPGLTKKLFKGSDSGTALYLGLEYVLLRQRFLQAAQTTLPTISGKGVFICFGAADTFRLGEKFVQALINSEFTDPILWVTDLTGIRNDYKKYKNVIILSNLSQEDMISNMNKAKVMIIPSSVLSFEAIALRKPVFTCYFVENQKLIHQGLLMNGLASGIGYISFLG